MVNDKAALIQSLAESVGITECFDPRIDGSRYDPNTGTLYCEGMVLTDSSVDRVKAWYRQQMNLYKEQAKLDDMKREYYIRYSIAYYAICKLDEERRGNNKI